MNIIGIRGHRGAGKTTISYLLGNTINYLVEKSKEDFDIAYRVWCDNIIENENVINECELKYVYFDSFADTLRLWVRLLLNCPENYVTDEYFKDHVVVNMKDFSYQVIDELPSYVLDREELYNIMVATQPKPITKNLYISLREFILYFGMDVMQRFFGANVWLKTLKNSSEFYESIFNEDNAYKVFIDVKMPSEVTYIKERNGIIVKVSRPGSQKKNVGMDKLGQDYRFDFEVFVNGDLYKTKDQIFNIAKTIVYGDKKEN